MKTLPETFYWRVYGGKVNYFVLASARITKYNGKISVHVLVLGTGGEKTTLLQEMASISMFGEVWEVHWISKL